MKNLIVLALAVLTLAGAAAVSDAQAPTPAYTAVVLDDLHCMGCAKKVNAKVTAVAGVAEMRVDLKAKTIWAIHKQNQTPSPRALWEAIEAADQQPVKMQTPTATHTRKP
jgi:copper chaperone CopZ